MQFQTLADRSAFLAFEDVVPKATSDAHVASAALYHCLGTIYLYIQCTTTVAGLLSLKLFAVDGFTVLSPFTQTNCCLPFDSSRNQRPHSP